MPEIVLADFSGGMNASAAVDKLDAKECLLAESVRFDEAGNVLISGANTIQNPKQTLSDGTSGNIHSLFYDAAIGCVAGVGTSVMLGASPALFSTSTAVNSQRAKMSFGIAPNRIYTDLSAVGYLKDVALADLITVDWAPPSSASAIVSGPNAAGTYSNGTSSNYGFSLGTRNMQGLSVTTVTTATVQISALDPVTHQSNFAVITTEGLIVGGVTVGTLKTSTNPGVSFGAATIPFSFTSTLGNGNDLWGDPTITPAQVNAVNFGIFFSFSVVPLDSSTVALTGTTKASPSVTCYQAASGFVASTGTAGALTGTYTWKVTFTAINGEESDASVASTAVTLSTQQGTLTAVPTGDIRTGGRNVYRKGGLLTAYYLVGTIPDNSTTTFADNLTDLAALAQAVILPGDTIGDEPNTRLGNKAVKYPTYHYDRVFWANGNMIIWSKPLNGFAYPVDFSSPVGNSKPIMGMVSQGGELIIIKPDGIWRMTGTDENSFQVSQTLSAVGTDWPFTIVAAGGSTTGFYFTGRIIFANRQGIWAFNGYNSSKISPKLDLWFRQDDRTGVAVQGVNGFHPPEIYNALTMAGYQAAANNTFYRLAYAESGQAANNAMLVLDLERGNISKRPFAAPSMAVEPTTGYFYAGSPTGIIVQLDDWNAANNGLGAAVNFDFQTKYNDLKLRGSKFAVFGIEFLIKTGGQTVTPSVYFDEGTGTAETLGTISTPQAARVFRKLNGINSRSCRNFSVRLNCSTLSANANGKPNIQLDHLKIYYEPRQARARTGEG